MHLGPQIKYHWQDDTKVTWDIQIIFYINNIIINWHLNIIHFHVKVFILFFLFGGSSANMFSKVFVTWASNIFKNHTLCFQQKLWFNHMMLGKDFDNNHTLASLNLVMAYIKRFLERMSLWRAYIYPSKDTCSLLQNLLLKTWHSQFKSTVIFCIYIV